MSDAPSDNRLKLGDFMPYRISVLSNTISTAIASAYSVRFKLSIPEWRVMAVLGVEPGLSAAQVAERTAMDKVAVSRAVTHLLHSKRVVRTLADADRRRSILSLSPAGQAVYKEVAPVALRYEQALLATLSAEERAQLDRLIKRLLDSAHVLGPIEPD